MRYMTKQRQIILEVLRSAGCHLTVADIVARCQSLGKPIGTTTAYRQVEAMMREGLVQKFVIDENSPACFAFAGEPEAGRALHCKCQECGRLLHIRCPEFEAMERHLSGEHDFQLDPRRTVLYGTCPECRAKAAAGGKGE